MEYYSAIKKECIWANSNEADETGTIIQSEVSQKENNIVH